MTAEPMSAVTTTTRRNIIQTSAVSATFRDVFAFFCEYMVQAVFAPRSRLKEMVAHPGTIHLPGARVVLSAYTWLIKSKMGKYIETTMPPTTTPRKRIRIGSIKVIKLATAVSTSSS